MQTHPKEMSGADVLIVEDEARLRDMLERAVRDMGLRPLTAATAEAALTLLDQIECPILILDLNLPGADGLDLLEALRARRPLTQAVILTGYGSLDAAQRAIRLEAVDFLTKPASLGEIEKALDRARKRLNRPAQPQDVRKGKAVSEQPQNPQGLEAVERHHIQAALERHNGNRAAAAAELGISLRKLYYKLAEYQRNPQP